MIRVHSNIKYPFTDGTTFNSKDYIEIRYYSARNNVGDKAVAVNLMMNEYKDLVGKKVIVPLVNREINYADDYVTQVWYWDR